MPRFMADECFPGPLLKALGDAGFDVSRSADTIPAASDSVVLALAQAEGRVLLTEDNDFGDLAVRLGIPTIGVLRIDLKALAKPARATRLIEALVRLGPAVEGALVTGEPTRTRVRRLAPPTSP